MTNDIPDHCAGEPDYHEDTLQHQQEHAAQIMRDAQMLQREAEKLGLTSVAKLLAAAVAAGKRGL